MSTQPTPQAPEQLSLMPAREVPLQFRLDQRTRQRGLAHIAAIKAQLAARAGEGRDARPPRSKAA